MMAKTGLISELRLKQHRAGVFSKLRYLNVAKRFPFGDNRVACIYSSEMLEHLPREVAPGFLLECHRVLIPGGILRIAVPDLDAMTQRYDSADPDSWLHELFALYSKGDKNRHWWHYNEGSLRKRLEEAGFMKIHRCRAGDGRCPDIDTIEARTSFRECCPLLFMEAIKS